MGITIIGTDGQPEAPWDEGPFGGPFQWTPGGRPTGLAKNSVPFSEYRGGASTWIRMYREQPWVKACVDKLTYQASRLPLGVFTGDPENPEQVHEGPLYDLIRRPAERCGPINLKQWMIKPALIHGKSPLQIIRRGAGGRPIGLRRLYPQWLSPRSMSGIPEDVDYWLYTRPNQPQPEVIQPRDLLLIAWESENGTFGTSPMRPLLMTLEIEAAARWYQHQLLRNGIRPPGGISWSDANPEVIALAENKDFRRMFEEEMTNALAGAQNAGKPIFMPPGAKWTSFAYSASDAELIAQRHLTREEVAAVYDIKPPELGVIDKSVGPAVPALLPSLFTTTLPPWLELICDSVGAQVIDPEPALQGQWLMFDLREAKQGDPEKDAAARKTDVMTGLRTINEARKLIKLPRIDHPDADRPLIPVNNMIFLGDSPKRTPAGERNAGGPQQNAQHDTIGRAIARAGNLAYRRLKAGDDDHAFDAERFERELAHDLAAAGSNGSSEPVARAWAGAVQALVADAAGDPDVLRTNFAALTPEEDQ